MIDILLVVFDVLGALCEENKVVAALFSLRVCGFSRGVVRGGIA